MNDRNITDIDVDTLDGIAADFTANVKSNYEEEKKFDARKVFVSKLSLKDKFNILVAKRHLAKVIDADVSPEKKARAILLYCESALPAMKKAFGEAFLVRSLPVEAQDDRVIDVAQGFGAHAIADLCQKAKARAAKMAPKAPAA